MRHYNFRVCRKYGKSKTVPNMALSVREINERFTQGKSIPSAKAPVHEPKLENMRNPLRCPYCDFVDIAEYNDSLVTRLNETTSLMTAKQQEFIRNMKPKDNHSDSSS